MSLVSLIVAGIDCTIGKGDGPQSCVTHRKLWSSTLTNETDWHVAFPWGPCFLLRHRPTSDARPSEGLIDKPLGFCLSAWVLLQY